MASIPADFCIKLDSDECHFYASFAVRNKVTRQCPHITTSGERKKMEKRYRQTDRERQTQRETEKR